MASNKDPVTGAIISNDPAVDNSHLTNLNANPDQTTQKDAVVGTALTPPEIDPSSSQDPANGDKSPVGVAQVEPEKSKSRRNTQNTKKVIKATARIDVSDSSDDSSDDSSEVSDTSSADGSGVMAKKPGRKGYKATKSKAKKKMSNSKLERKVRTRSGNQGRPKVKINDAVSDDGSESEDSSGSESSAAMGSDSSSSTPSDAVKRKHKYKSGSKRERTPKGRSNGTDQQIKTLQLQVAQLTQLLQSQQIISAQAPAQLHSFGLGSQPSTLHQLPQTSILPGTNRYTPPAFPEATIIEPPKPIIRNSILPTSQRNRALQLRSTQSPSIVEGDESPSDSIDSLGRKVSSRVKKQKKGTRADFKRVDWVWDSSLYTWKLQDSTESPNESQYEEYIFHVRRSFDIEGKYRSTTVDIKSKLLRECLQDVIGDVKGLSLVDESPKTDPNLLFLYLEDLHAHRRQLKQVKPAGDSKKERKRNQKRLDNKRQQLKVLIKYLDKDYAKIKDSLYPMLKNGLITFELLWALWKPGTLAFTTTYGSTDEPRVFKVELAERHKSFMKGELYHLDGKYLEFDGKKFGFGGVSDEILAFRGARKITTLACYPLQYHPEEAQLRERLIERGKKFVALSGVHYKSYSGMAFQKSKKCVVKFNIQQSRIMVDPAIFRRINPNYFVSPLKAQEDTIVFGIGLSEEDESEEGYDSSQSHDRALTRAVNLARQTAAGLLGASSNGTDTDLSIDIAEPVTSGVGLLDRDGTCETRGSAGKKSIQTFSDADYLLASPVVLGFAFTEKQWLEFTVDGVKEIVWNDTAWDSLVSEPETKDLVQALVKSRKFHAANTIDDVIQGKGKGLVTVLHGPPGTGKTLTAEGISELLKCPLYMASASELGTDARFLEAELQKILDICHAWGAILLLDEADVFLEKRTMLDIHRNALVSIFLRQLEYFQGILFLTTNRVETFDEAFQSRIHIALRYNALEQKAKRAIFKMFIERVRKYGKMKVAEFSEEDLDTLSRKDLNGREIKNVVSSAQDLAVNKEEALSMAHIKQVLDVHARFGRDLKGGAGFEDAMRSYF